MLYLSQAIGRPVRDQHGEPIGKVADLIVAIEHKRVRTVEELLTEVEKHRPGETIRVTVVRDGKPMDVRVRLGES